MDTTEIETTDKCTNCVPSVYSSQSYTFMNPLENELTSLQTAGIISVLEETVDQMAIIKHLLPLVDKSSHESGEYQSLEERFALENTPKLFYPGQRTNSFLTYRMKIQRDRTLIELVLRRTLIDLKKDKTFHSLKESIEANHRKNKEEVQLLDKEDKFEKNVRDLNHRLIAGQNQGNKKANSCLEKIAHLKDLFHDAMLQGRMEMYYIKQWEKSRQEQNEMRSNKNEQELTARSQRLAKLKQSEQRANAEVMAYLESAILNLELKINEWIIFYERSIEEKDESLLILTIEKERNMIRKNELQKLYDEHKEEINKYLKHRELKRQEIERKAFINSMATRLQTWWRGIMYRHKLERNSPRKKKKAKKDRKNKSLGKSKKTTSNKY